MGGWMDGRLAGWLAGCPYGWLCACVIMAAPWNSLSGIAGRSPGLDVGVRVSLCLSICMTVAITYVIWQADSYKSLGLLQTCLAGASG